jgi:hypothetical protein
MSYYGKNVLQLQDGINYVVGQCGSGRTNLVRAVQFAILGCTDVPRRILINDHHRRECLRRKENASCEVEVDLWINDQKYLCKSIAMLNEKDEITHSTTVNLEIDQAMTLEKYKLIYLNCLNLEFDEEDFNKYQSTRIWNALSKYMHRNIKEGLKMVILYQVMDHFDALTRRNFQTALLEYEMEQIIVIDAINQEYQNNPKYNIIHVVEYGVGSSKIVKPFDDERALKIEAEIFVGKLDSAILLFDAKKNLGGIAEQIELLTRKIDQETAQFSLHIKEMTAIMAQYYVKKDLARANVYGSRIAEKVLAVKLAVQVKLVLEKTSNLLYLANTDEKSAETLLTAVELVRKVRGIIHCVLPTIEHDLGNIESSLNEIAKGIFKENKIENNTYPVSDQVDAILNKTFQDAELEVKEKVAHPIS